MNVCEPPVRTSWVDWLKALAALAVVVGHSGCGETITRVAYSFHIPLFFLVSGYLSHRRASSSAGTAVLRLRIHRLLRLYFAFALALLPFRILGSQVGAQTIPLLEALKRAGWSIFYASGDPRLPYALVPAALWFFPALIIGHILLWAITRLGSQPRQAIALVIVAASGIKLSSLALPWELETGMFAAALMGIGWWARELCIPERIDGHVGVIAAAMLCGGACLIAARTSQLDMYVGRWEEPLWHLAAGTLMILGALRLAMRLPRSSFVERFAGLSLYVFPTHQVIFVVLDGGTRLHMGLHAFLVSHPLGYGIAKSAIVWPIVAFGLLGMNRLYKSVLPSRQRSA